MREHWDIKDGRAWLRFYYQYLTVVVVGFEFNLCVYITWYSSTVPAPARCPHRKFSYSCLQLFLSKSRPMCSTFKSLRDTVMRKQTAVVKWLYCSQKWWEDRRFQFPAARRAAVPAGFQASLFKLFLHYLIIHSKWLIMCLTQIPNKEISDTMTLQVKQTLVLAKSLPEV